MKNKKTITKSYKKALDYKKEDKNQMKEEINELIIKHYSEYFESVLTTLGFIKVSEEGPNLFIHPKGMIIMQHLFFIEGYYKYFEYYDCEHVIYETKKIDNRQYLDDLNRVIEEIEDGLNEELYTGYMPLPKQSSNKIFKNLYEEAIYITNGLCNFDIPKENKKNKERTLTR